MTAQRVAITGMGVVSALGGGRQAHLQALRRGASGIRRLESIDASSLNCRIGGEVPREVHEGKFKGYDRFTRLALIAAEEAADQARYDAVGVPPESIGALVGTGLGGCETLDANYKRLYRDNQTRVPPTSIPLAMYNAAASAVSTRFGARGVSYAVVSACSSSAHAIGLAFQAIRGGQADVMFAGGADAPLTAGIIRAWEGLRVLSINNEEPEEACRPFSADRNGLVLAEGAAMLILESWDRAQARSQPILGEIVGFGATSDAGHLTDPSPDGAARAMRQALRDAGAAPADVDAINAHGTATRANDPTETAAIKEVFGERAGRIPVSGTKSMHGHAMGASGAIEIVLSLLAGNEGFVPPTLNLRQPDPQCDLDYVPLEARPQRVGLFLSNSFGFGGMNAVVAVRTAVAADLLRRSESLV